MLSEAQKQKACDDFNACHAIGDRIQVWPFIKEGPGETATIDEPGAFVLQGHTAVVRVLRRKGTHDVISLTHVGALQESSDATTS